MWQIWRRKDFSYHVYFGELQMLLLVIWLHCHNIIIFFTFYNFKAVNVIYSHVQR